MKIEDITKLAEIYGFGLVENYNGYYRYEPIDTIYDSHVVFEDGLDEKNIREILQSAWRGIGERQAIKDWELYKKF